MFFRGLIAAPPAHRQPAGVVRTSSGYRAVTQDTEALVGVMRAPPAGPPAGRTSFGTTFFPGLIGPGALPDLKRGDPRVDLVTGQPLTPTQLMAAIAGFTGAAISRPQRYDLMVQRYAQVVWVYRAVSINAQNVAAVPFKIYKRTGEGKGRGGMPLGPKGDLEETPTHPMAVLLKTVNPMMSSYDLWELTSINMDLVGNSYWIIFRDGLGRPAEIWPVRPDRVEVLGSLTEGIGGYRYRVPRGTFDFHKEDVVHIKYQNPWNDFYGQGAMSAAWAQIEAFEALMIYRKAFYDNGARPDGVLSTDGLLGEEQVQQLAGIWASQYQGPRNAGRTAIVHSGLKYQIVAATPRDAMLVKDVELSRDDILAAFGVSKEAAGISTGGGLGDSGHHRSAVMNYREQTVKPRLKKIEVTVNEKLAPNYPDKPEGEFDTSDFIRDDEERRSNIDAKDIEHGELSPNEARERRGLPPYEGGDTYFVASPLVPIDRAITPPPPPMPFGGGPGAPGAGGPVPSNGEKPTPADVPKPGMGIRPPGNGKPAAPKPERPNAKRRLWAAGIALTTDALAQDLADVVTRARE